MAMARPEPEPLRARLRWDSAQGSLHDGPRRYLMMRPDVLMGALHAVDTPVRHAMLDALAASTRAHGADSLRAYAAQVGGNTDALMAATQAAAADLGWGRWTLRRDGPRLHLEVADSPFAAGWRAVDGRPALQPVCAPVRGMFGALASLVLGTAVQAEECDCAAMHAPCCRFVATGTA